MGNIINYDNLQTGDIVLTTGIGLFSRGIKTITKSRITHVGIVIELYGKKVIAEMLGNGLNISTFKRYTLSKKRHIVQVVRPSYLGSFDRFKIRERILDDWIKKIDYDWGGVLKFIFKGSKNDKKKYFCSEYVAEILDSRLHCFEQEPADIDPSELAFGNNNYACTLVAWRN